MTFPRPIEIVKLILMLIFAAVTQATVASAQSNVSASIAGTVKDASGAVLTGAIVIVESPALIEKTRSTTTDQLGQFRIIDLAPGLYSVTFTSPGFATFRRDGLELQGGVTANVDGQMTLGSVSQTVTVSAETPLVDIQNATQTRDLTNDLVENLPVGRQMITYLVLVPGVSIIGSGAGTNVGADVGGSAGDKSFAASVHGSDPYDTPHEYNGMRQGILNNTAAGTNGLWVPNTAMTEQIVETTSGNSAEEELAGVHADQISRQGSDKWHGYFYTDETNSSLQANNLTQTLIARGAPTPDVLTKIYDINAAIGGPILPSKLWFYASYRDYGVDDQPSGAHFAADPVSAIFTPGSGQPVNVNWTHQYNADLTWAINPKNKLFFYGDNLLRNAGSAAGLSSATAYEASIRVTTPTDRLLQAIWTWTVSDHTLIQVGETYRPDQFVYLPQKSVLAAEGPGAGDLSGITDVGTGLTYRAPTTSLQGQVKGYQQNGRASVAYVTGAHSLKVGSQWMSGISRYYNAVLNNSYYTFRNGVPNSVTLFAGPYGSSEKLTNLGFFAQDQWTHKRLTVSGGVRFDYLNMYGPANHIPAVQYATARNIPAIANLPDWKDINPRLGAAYDLFGSGKTALKWNIGRFVESEGTSFPQVTNPANANSTTTRSWNDLNSNFIPDCDLTNPVANGECGPDNNANFGLPIVASSYAPSIAQGWDVRAYNWEMMAGVEQQLRPGLALSASYNRRWFGNLEVPVNTAQSPADFSPFCVTAPVDPRLLGGGGNQICGLYNVNPAQFSASNTVYESANSLGGETAVYDGVDVTVNVRLKRAITLQGGTSTGRVKQNVCNIVDNYPNATIAAQTSTSGFAQAPFPLSSGLYPALPGYCNVVPPLQTQIKFLGVVPLPWWGLQTSFAFQSAPGPQVLATWAAPASAIMGLGRPLSGGATTVSVPLVPAGSLYGDRLNQVDLRFTRNFVFRERLTVQPLIDLYNIFNASPVLTQNNTYGAKWLQPQSMLLGRMLKLGVQVNF